MGNTTSRRRVVGCFVPASSSKDGPVNLDFLGPLDEGLGHSFCYVRPIIADYSSPAITPSNSERFTVDSTTFDSETHSGSFRHDMVDDLLRPAKAFPETTFKTISGASVSANVSTARTGNTSILLSSDAQEPAASFESTASFAAIPLQPVPRGSGPLNGNGFLSGPLERGFASGPLERGGAGFMSGPLEKGVFMSGPLDGTADRGNFSAPLAFGRRRVGFGRLVRNMSRPMKSVLTRTFTRRVPGPGWMHRFLLHPMTKFVWNPKEAKFRPEAPRNCMEVGPSEPEYSNTRNLQWAHGKAGEDRVHVVLSEEQGWLFVGIYDGFSGPDAPDFLMSNLYKAIDKELEGLLWDYEEKARKTPLSSDAIGSSSDCVKDGSVASPCYNPHSEKQCVPSHLGDDCFENQCHEGVLPLQSKEDECQEKSILDDRSIEEAVEAVEIVEEKNGTKEMDCLPMATIEILQEPEGNMLNRDTEAGHIVMPPDGATPVLPNRCKKSKRLYELLQMEPVEHYEPKNSQLALEYSSRETSSLDLPSNAGEDLCMREGLPVALQFSCSASIKGEGSSSMGETESFRENEGALGEDSEDFKQRSVPSFSVPGHKQMIKRSLIGSRLRKIYRKQKSLRKKLFPWNYDWHRDQPQMVDTMVNQSAVIRRCKSGLVDHDAVLKAISRALQTTEEAYMEMVEASLDRNPELALMGSCVLVMLMKDQDVYVMNLGDSRVILAQDRLNDRHNNLDFARDDSSHRNRSRESLVRVELDRISEESPMHNLNSRVCKVNKTREISICRQKMRAAQLSTDHSTSIEEEVLRIKAEHPDDAQAILNDRVKGQLKVTRAFGAGFLKKLKFNEALLEMFQVDYVGTSPYVSCIPSVLHHRLCPNDRFLVLSSDGLYQYFSNEEVVSHVAWFMENVPEGDPAQYLIAELLLRAAKKNGMDFHELLDIPHGDRRKYHDDVSVMVISLEGRIWRSSG